jgi:hypothetical protein
MCPIAGLLQMVAWCPCFQQRQQHSMRRPLRKAAAIDLTRTCIGRPSSGSCATAAQPSALTSWRRLHPQRQPLQSPLPPLRSPQAARRQMRRRQQVSWGPTPCSRQVSSIVNSRTWSGSRTGQTQREPCCRWVRRCGTLTATLQAAHAQLQSGLNRAVWQVFKRLQPCVCYSQSDPACQYHAQALVLCYRYPRCDQHMDAPCPTDCSATLVQASPAAVLTMTAGVEALLANEAALQRGSDVTRCTA